MRVLLSLVLLVGVSLVGATAFLAIDSLATDDRRAAVQDAIADRATAHDAGESRRRGLMGRLASGYQALAGGIFKSSGLDLPAALPPAPEGWVQRDYVDADGMAITGAAYKKSGISISTTNSILGRFDKARGAGKMTARATYAAGAQMIAIYMKSDMKALRKAEAGTLRAPALGGDVFARLDGVPVVLRPQINETVMTGKITPVAYRYFTLSLDGQVSIGLLTNADDAAVLALLSGIDMAGLQASLPVESRGFAAGTGIVPAGPASEG